MATDPPDVPDEPGDPGTSDEPAITLPEPMRRRLEAAREAKGWSRAVLGQKLGITGTQIYRIERGLRGTTPSRVQQWLVACGFGAEYVELGTDDPERKALLLTAIGGLQKVDLDPVTKIVAAWPGLSAKDRRTILSVIEPADE
jgi:transcriptional regulator with XRE-family HTH domain